MQLNFMLIPFNNSPISEVVTLQIVFWGNRSGMRVSGADIRGPLFIEVGRGTKSGREVLEDFSLTELLYHLYTKKPTWAGNYYMLLSCFIRINWGPFHVGYIQWLHMSHMRLIRSIWQLLFDVKYGYSFCCFTWIAVIAHFTLGVDWLFRQRVSN